MTLEEAVKKYLDDYASESEAFAKKYSQGGKSIADCCQYITSEAKKLAVRGCACISDDQVFQWARHYYEESNDNLKIDTKVKAEVKVSENKPKVETKVEKPKVKKPKVEKKEVKKDFEQLDLFYFLGV